MKIKIYVITYDNSKELNETLDSLWSSNLLTENIEVIIINNYSSIKLSPLNISKTLLLNNVLRPDFSTGHLSRNWNQALINGFKDLNKPDADIVIHCQDDTIFHTDWLVNLLQLHKKYSFITSGAGDNFCSYLPDAIKKIGLWDERFCNIGFQEADYFLRALMYNKNNSCINDFFHERILNPTTLDIVSRPQKEYSANHNESRRYHSISATMFKEKYGLVKPERWNENLINSPPKTTLCKNFIFYPYFEKNIENLDQKNYLYSSLETYDHSAYKSIFDAE